MSRPYIVRISSQKGGVGKTTVATNFASVIRGMGYKVLIVDFDFANPSIGFHLGMEDSNSGVRAVLKSKASVSNIVAIHEPTGLHVLAGEVKGWQRTPNENDISDLMRRLKKTAYNFVIVDTSPGFDLETSMKSFDEDIIVTTPDMPSCASASRLSAKYDKLHLKHSLMLNKVMNTRYELGYDDVMDMYGGSITGTLPSDEAVPASIAAHIPAYVFRPRSRFAKAVGGVSSRYASNASASYPILSAKQNGTIWRRVLGLFGGRRY